MTQSPLKTFLSTAFFIAVAIAAAVLVNLPTGDLVYLPSTAEAIDNHIQVAGHQLKPHRGSLFITFVSEVEGTTLNEFIHRFNAEASIVSRRDLYGNAPPPPVNQQRQANMQMMVDSKGDAEFAALQAAGYHIPVMPQVVVVSVDPRSKAYNKLQTGDVIAMVNGHMVHSDIALIRLVRRLKSGTAVTLYVRRDYRLKSDMRKLTFNTVTLHGHTALGVTIGEVYIKGRLPLHITIDSGDIEGPSAGLMFALAIVNRLSPVDLTHGHRIAGTGTIDPSGSVGPIGGIKQKLFGARRAGAEYFFVPSSENYAEAKPYAGPMKLVPVATLADALRYLHKLH